MEALNLPNGAELGRLLDIESVAEIEDLFSACLTAPVRDLFSRPRKDIRGQIVRLGFEIAAAIGGEEFSVDSVIVSRACEILELLHAGSLVVDDIQDGTRFRRGGEALHHLYGMPVALNAGNWLYFLPFQLIETLETTEARRAAIMRECQRTLLLGHYGQALDVGVAVDDLQQARVPKVVKTSIELKSGVLAGLALKFGAIAMGRSQSTVLKLDQYGRKLGAALQMFDDVGNLSCPDPDKRGEDFKLKRLSFLTSIAAEKLSPEDYTTMVEMMSAVEQNGISHLQDFFRSHDLIRLALEQARECLRSATQGIKTEFEIQGLPRLDLIEEKLVHAYV